MCKWHWWAVCPQTLHIQFAANPAKFDPNIGATWVFDATTTKIFNKSGKTHGLRGKAITSPTETAATGVPSITPSKTEPVSNGTYKPNPSSSAMDTLTKQAPNAIEWALAPLDQAVPGDVRQNLTFLREDLLDEAKIPKASPEAYKLGAQICNTLLDALEERSQTLACTGFRAVEAAARTGVSNQALEARRNYKMSWPQFAREESQRAELKSQAIGNAQVMAERPKLEWVQRTTTLRKTLDALYALFREALRQSPAPAK